MFNKVIIVDEENNELGFMEKLKAHQEGWLHRAFSIFIFNSKGEMLLQKRAAQKYHSGGLWTNACCSHPQPKKQLLKDAQLRLQQEMGFTCDLEHAFEFSYKSEFENGLIENEYDFVLIGYYDGPVNPNPKEVEDFCFKSIDDVKKDLKKNPNKYTCWFKIALPKIEEYLLRNTELAS